MKNICLTAAMSLAMMLIAGQAVADTIVPNCASCYGNTFTLSYSTVGTDLFRITLIVDTSGFTAIADPEWLNSVSIKIASQDADYLSVTSVAAPANWSESLSLYAGFLTDTNTGATQFDLPDGTLTWVWDIGIAPGALFSGPDAVSVRANYMRIGPQGGVQQRNTSEDITLQSSAPEPTSLLLLGTGLGVIGFAAWRRKR